MEPDFIPAIRESVEELLSSNLYCAEIVVLSIAKARGIEFDLLPKIASAFCGGMSHTCGTCGALTGAMMGVSLSIGRSAASESIIPIRIATKRLILEFELEFGARDCNVLLGCDLDTEEGQIVFKKNRLWDERCQKYIIKAAEIAVSILHENNH